MMRAWICTPFSGEGLLPATKLVVAEPSAPV
jgi:hypothetical protein